LAIGIITKTGGHIAEDIFNKIEKHLERINNLTRQFNNKN